MEAIEDIGDLRDQVLEYLKALGFEINLDAPQSLTLFTEEKAYLRQLHEKARRSCQEVCVSVCVRGAYRS
jgi:hypothetical protein